MQTYLDALRPLQALSPASAPTMALLLVSPFSYSRCSRHYLSSPFPSLSYHFFPLFPNTPPLPLCLSLALFPYSKPCFAYLLTLPPLTSPCLLTPCPAPVQLNLCSLLLKILLQLNRLIILHFPQPMKILRQGNSAYTHFTHRIPAQPMRVLHPINS